MQRRWAFWLAILAGWTLLAVVFAVSSSLTYALTYQPPRWRYTFTMAATEWYVWAALTPLVAWTARRLRPSAAHWWRVIVLAVSGVPVAFFKVSFTRAVRGALDGGAAYFQITDLAVHYLIYWGIVFATYAWLQYRESQARELRTSQLEAVLAQTRLQMLSMQLQPHFLFNTLNTIAELVHRDAAAAERMIAGLSHLLRETLHAGLVEQVPLSQELSLLERYVEIQRARFGDRLQFSVTAEDFVRGALVPSLLLQPLVENAIKHGIGARSGAGRIDVKVSRRGERLVIEILDDGPGLGVQAIADGVGLSNCRSRLQTLFGSDGRLAIANRGGGGAIVTIELPFHVAYAEVPA
ncbi:MAG TPA: sensor histidine kinase [Vicinamibacterales bacterium]|nr:sensor histidine kinase [Vicinamibacterales bacterium]